jgi:DNA-binding cell septation regulator SpoVG
MKMMEFFDIGKLSEVLTKKRRPIVNGNNRLYLALQGKRERDWKCRPIVNGNNRLYLALQGKRERDWKFRPIVNGNNDFTIVCSHKLGFILPVFIANCLFSLLC